MPTLALYHYWRSSCSWRVRWALALKGAAYQSIPINLLQGEHQTPGYKRINPAGFLPTLMIDGVPYGESLAILEWIEEMFPLPALLPQDRLSRLYVRQLALAITAGTQPLQNPAVLAHFTADQNEKAQHAKYFIARGLTTFESLLQRGRPGTYCFGGSVTIADLCLVPQVYNALRFQVDMQAFPLISGIYQRCLATSACNQAAPHTQPGATP